VRCRPIIIFVASAGITPAALAAISAETGRWVPGLGDPTWFGWMTVLAYVAAGVLCLGNSMLAAQALRPARFWTVTCVFMFALALNKQLDLQSWFTQMGRDLALSQGWYEWRRVVQLFFILSLALGGFAAAFALRYWLRDSWSEYRVACVGAIALMVFIVARAAAFHHVDTLIGMRLRGVRLNVIFELSAIALVALGAFRWRTRMLGARRRERRGRSRASRARR
jgi:hypothetical protein